MILLDKQLEAFIQVAGCGSVHGAAKQLYITQTALTMRIKMLEQKLGSALFVRARSGMRLTPEGESLLHYAKLIKQMEGECLAQIKGTDPHTLIPIAISAPSSMMHSSIMAAFLSVAAKYPYLRLRFEVDDSSQQASLLQTGKVDFAVLAPEHISADMQQKMLKPQQYYLAISKKWAHREVEDIIENESIIDFNPQDAMSFEYLKQLGLFDKAQKQRHFVNDIQLLQESIGCGLAYSVLPSCFFSANAHPEVVLLDQLPALEQNMALCWYWRSEMPDYFKTLLSMDL